MGHAALTAALAHRKVIAVDTMAFIYHLEDHPDYGALTEIFFTQLSSSQFKAVGSALCITELLVAPARLGNLALLEEYRRLLFAWPNLILLPVSAEIADRAAIVRAESGLALPDAIHLATAEAGGADAILTNDRRVAAASALPAIFLSDFR